MRGMACKARSEVGSVWRASTKRLVSRLAIRSLDAVKNTLKKQCKPRLAVHHALDELHSGYMPFNLSVSGRARLEESHDE
jgi:hypothetical protein